MAQILLRLLFLLEIDGAVLIILGLLAGVDEQRLPRANSAQEEIERGPLLVKGLSNGVDHLLLGSGLPRLLGIDGIPQGGDVLNRHGGTPLQIGNLLLGILLVLDCLGPASGDAGVNGLKSSGLLRHTVSERLALGILGGQVGLRLAALGRVLRGTSLLHANQQARQRLALLKELGLFGLDGLKLLLLLLVDGLLGLVCRLFGLGDLGQLGLGGLDLVLDRK
mmetsp:Transcript_19459/g.46025  ORF Transcript_19459/g.46025 Transcript_19459/m.46025 type:complete len:222 (+) Transcript_19459:1185-1850(+)